MSTTTTTLTDRDQARKQLREMIRPGETLWTVRRHAAASGMSHVISVVQIVDKGRVRDLDGLVCRALGLKFDGNHGGVKVNGGNMDMGFDLVYSLSRALYGGERSYPCLGDRCPSNEHTNDYTAPRGRGLGIRHDDGYAISQRWI